MSSAAPLIAVLRLGDGMRRYSYGQPVRGTWSATIQVTTSNWRYNNEWWDSDRDVGAIVKTMERKGTLDAATGCSQLKVAGDGLGLHLGADDDDDRNVRVTAVVTEAGTGLQANATWSVDVQRHRLQVKVRTRGHETFKNGLPYYGSLQVSHGDGTPAAGVEVRVCAKPTHLPATSPAPVPYQKPLVGSIIQDIESQILPNQSLEPKDEELVDIIQDPEPPEPEPEPEPLEPEPLEPEPLEPEPLEPEPLEPEPEPELEPGPEPEPEPEPESEWDQEKPVGTLIESKVEVLQEVEEELFVAVHVRRPEPPLPPPRAPPAPEYCAVRQSDAHGMARFELLPNEADIIEYDIKVGPFSIVLSSNRSERNLVSSSFVDLQQQLDLSYNLIFFIRTLLNGPRVSLALAVVAELAFDDGTGHSTGER